MNKVFKFMSKPLNSQWNAIKRLLRYLQGTISFDVVFRPSSQLLLQGFTNVDWHLAMKIVDQHLVLSYSMVLIPLWGVLENKQLSLDQALKPNIGLLPMLHLKCYG